VQKRLTARKNHDRRAALVHGVQGIGHGNSLVENFVWVIDLAATGAGKIAPEERLEHQHEGIAFAASEVLSDDVGPDRQRLAYWNSHPTGSPDCDLEAAWLCGYCPSGGS
jgi:hypothetical protein